MSELRVGAKVEGTDGELGVVEAVVIDPTADAVTHLVVSRDAFGPRSLVPRTCITSSDPDRVVVDLDEQGLRDCQPFDAPQYNAPGAAWTLAEFDYEPGAYYLEPYASPLDAYALTVSERVPKGEVTIRRHDEVVSSDGTHLGHVDEFLVDPKDGHITHVVLREGHALRRDDDVVVPLAGSTVEEGRVVLGLDLPAVNELERVPVHRHGHVRDADDPSGSPGEDEAR